MHRPAGPAAGGGRRFALTRWFAGVGAVAIGLFSVGMGWLLTGCIAASMLVRDAALSRDLAQSIASIQPVAGFFGSRSTVPDGSRVEFFTHVAGTADAPRAHVDVPVRRAMWSSRPAEYVENHLPVYDDHHPLMAVIGLYRQPAALFAAIRPGRRLVWIGAGAGGLALFLVLLGFVRRTDCMHLEQQCRRLDGEAPAIVGEWSAGVAHHILNPLVSIRSSAELQRELTGDPGGEHAEMLVPTAVIGRRELAFVVGGEPSATDAPEDDLNLKRAERRLLGVSRDTLRCRLERLQLRSGYHAA